MVQEPLASVLRSGRDNFNALFAEARRSYPKLDATAFSDFVVNTLDPLVHACPLPIGELAPLAEAGFELGLELVGQNLAGKNALGNRTIEAAWRTIAPANWPLVASEPQHFFASISNAVHRLSANKTIRADEWTAAMSRLASQAGDIDGWLRLGQVLAWRAGMAEWRLSALAVAATLPEALAKAAVGAAADTTWSAVRERLEQDGWFDPSSGNDSEAKPPLRLVTKIGAFRGLGGRFAAPPMVAAEGDQLFVRSADQCWLLIADAFGHSFHNATMAEFERARSQRIAVESVRISETKISAAGSELPNPVPGTMTSVAVLPHTLAITSSVSHAVFLFGY